MRPVSAAMLLMACSTRQPLDVSPAPSEPPSEATALTGCAAVQPATASYGHADPYGHLALDTTGERPTWLQGDPCAVNNAACMYDATARTCVDFEPVTQCPDDHEAAAALAVACTHPDQPELSCGYDGVVVECTPVAYPRGGRMPPPGSYDRPSEVWMATWDYDDLGCPNSRRALEEACTVTPDQCMAFDAIWTCEAGQWVGEPLPPRP